MQTKKRLTKAPLVMSVLHLRFTETPSLNPINEETLKHLHERMIIEGFQEKIESEANIIDVAFDPQKQQMKHSQVNKKRILFRSAGEKNIIEISDTSIILKTTDYIGFENFYGIFNRVVSACLEVLEGLNSALLKSVGLRYVDLFAPTNGASLDELIANDVLPPSLNMIDSNKHIQGATLKVIETNPGQVLVVNFEELRTIENKVQKVLPDNLMEQDTKCGLVILGQQEWLNVTSDTYGLLDVDHTHHFNQSPLFNADSIESAALELYQHSNDVFWNIITDKAQIDWGMEVINVE
jgi:uncharacterized protein (TIGR04255 family)